MVAELNQVLPDDDCSTNSDLRKPGKRYKLGVAVCVFGENCHPTLNYHTYSIYIKEKWINILTHDYWGWSDSSVSKHKDLTYILGAYFKKSQAWWSQAESWVYCPARLT